MAKSKLERALGKGKGAAAYGNTTRSNKELTTEEVMQEAFENKRESEADGGTSMARNNKRKELLAQAGFDYFDVRDLIPNEENSYTIDEGSIEALASLIYESKNTTPLVIRETEKGLQIIDGERRYRAHLLLGERFGEFWYMVPARCFRIGTLSDEDALFILHAENVGQRNMTPSERSRGFAAVADRIVAQRKKDPSTAEGKATKAILAEQFGVSERTAVMEVNIGKHLGEAAMELYDEGAVTKVGADAMAKLPVEEQEELVEKVKAGEVPKAEVADVARGRKRTSTRIPKSTDQHLHDARRCLKRALTSEQMPDRVVIAELRNLLDKLDPDFNRSEQD